MPTALMRDFVDELTSRADAGAEPAELAETAGVRLSELLSRGDLLAEQHCRPDACRYRQHVVHVDDAGRFSVVALVWLPGQATPIHSHVAWCVTGVVRGQELEQRFDVVAGDDGPTLRRAEATVNQPGAVSVLVPPEMDVHQVSCASSELTVSIHVYGANIAELGSSINVVYDEERILA